MAKSLAMEHTARWEGFGSPSLVSSWLGAFCDCWALGGKSRAKIGAASCSLVTQSTTGLCTGCPGCRGAEEGTGTGSSPLAGAGACSPTMMPSCGCCFASARLRTECLLYVCIHLVLLMLKLEFAGSGAGAAICLGGGGAAAWPTVWACCCDPRGMWDVQHLTGAIGSGTTRTHGPLSCSGPLRLPRARLSCPEPTQKHCCPQLWLTPTPRPVSVLLGDEQQRSIPKTMFPHKRSFTGDLSLAHAAFSSPWLENALNFLIRKACRLGYGWDGPSLCPYHLDVSESPWPWLLQVTGDPGGAGATASAVLLG